MGLGLCVKAPQPQVELVWVHGFLTVLLPIVIVLFVGCKNKVDLGEPPLGPEVSSSSLNDVLIKALGSKSEASISKTESSAYEINFRVETGEIRKISDIATTVLDRVETDQDITIYLSEATTNYTVGKAPDTVVREFRFVIPREVKTASLFSLLDDSASRGPIRRTYHNLRVKTDFVDPPESVRLKEGCGGVRNCQIPITMIAFDEADWQPDGTFNKSLYRYAFSSETPYLANLINGCMTTYVAVETRNYLVTQCKVLRDFTF